MINKSSRSWITVGGLLAFLTFALSLRAAPVDLLRQAYAALEAADHDYKGHRVMAMKAVEAAGKELGAHIGGGGKGREQQVVSDDQLRTALGLLQQASGELSGKPLKHVERAIKQISIALAIK